MAYTMLDRWVSASGRMHTPNELLDGHGRLAFLTWGRHAPCGGERGRAGVGTGCGGERGRAGIGAGMRRRDGW